jgi:hypothetical protein
MIKSLIVEDIDRIKSLMGIINESKISLPIVVSGSYTAPKGDADALHSFERRKSDGFGGRMTSKVDDKLKEVYNAGINPDITDIKININSQSYTVNWSVTIDESKDGIAYMGLTTRGSAGGGADRRAQGQIDGLMRKMKRKGYENIELALDFKNPSGVYIRQFFYKYSIPNKFPSLTTKGEYERKPQEQQKTDTEQKTDIEPQNNIESKFKSWKSGEYKIKGDNTWTYKLNSNKEWEAKKYDGEYKNLKTNLSPESYDTALNVLTKAEKIS